MDQKNHREDGSAMIYFKTTLQHAICFSVIGLFLFSHKVSADGAQAMSELFRRATQVKLSPNDFGNVKVSHPTDRAFAGRIKCDNGKEVGYTIAILNLESYTSKKFSSTWENFTISQPCKLGNHTLSPANAKSKIEYGYYAHAGSIVRTIASGYPFGGYITVTGVQLDEETIETKPEVGGSHVTFLMHCPDHRKANYVSMTGSTEDFIKKFTDAGKSYKNFIENNPNISVNSVKGFKEYGIISNGCLYPSSLNKHMIAPINQQKPVPESKPVTQLKSKYKVPCTSIQLTKWLITKLKKDHDMNITEDATALLRIKNESEKALLDLAQSPSTEINLPFLGTDAKGAPKHLKIMISRAQLEKI